ncbi:hypothetical protein IZ6_16820 [Terrihabitans soli]|uniref:Anti-sigma factor n=1 Tax=Terrihabitans soli TaxID=708113 RepID=A0A6S6QSM3_9HYPH|nr:hypothetical protein [Terrihabitans soli]BCJ90947.1 hypothetical protein IZ6_16820 [Terrihabitans soli]
MNMTQDEKDEISLLLPWYAAGTLSASETRRVAAAIASDPELQQRLDYVRDEAAETLLANESIAAPSRRVADKLFAGIDAEIAKNPRAYAPKFSLSNWFAEKAEAMRPRTLAFAGMAAALIIAVQAGFIVSNIAPQGEGGDTTLATTIDPIAAPGPQLLVNFQPTATVGDIEGLLKQAGGTIVNGPEAGLYRVKIGPSTIDQAGVDKIIELLRDKPDVVRFVAAASN